MNVNGMSMQDPACSSSAEERLNSRRLIPTLFEIVFQNWRNWTCFGIFVILFCIVEYAIQPFKKHISEDELSDLKFPKTDETVPTFIVPLCSLLIPTGVYLVHYCSNRDARELHDLIFGSLLSLSLTALTTASLKVYVGRPRPDFIERCFGTTNVSDASLHGLNCTSQDEESIEEGRKSFPSGHSSWMMCSMSFLTLFLLGQFRVFNGQGRGWSLVISLIPVTFAAFVGLTRFHDYRHHWTDVVTGFGIGMFFASMVYLSYYPSPFQRADTRVPLYKTQGLRNEMYQTFGSGETDVCAMEKV